MRNIGSRAIRGGRLGLVVLLVALLAGCGPAAASGASTTAAGAPQTPSAAPAPSPAPTAVPTPVATQSVVIQDFAFSPATIVVRAGSTVTWTNQDVEQHTVTARDHSFSSDAVESGKTFQWTFARAGTFEYFCQIHPNMVGHVIVTAP